MVGDSSLRPGIRGILRPCQQVLEICLYDPMQKKYGHSMRCFSNVQHPKNWPTVKETPKKHGFLVSLSSITKLLLSPNTRHNFTFLISEPSSSIGKRLLDFWLTSPHATKRRLEMIWRLGPNFLCCTIINVGPFGPNYNFLPSQKWKFWFKN